MTNDFDFIRKTYLFIDFTFHVRIRSKIRISCYEAFATSQTKLDDFAEYWIILYGATN